MDIVVEHKNQQGKVTREFAVREGTAMEYVACVPCRGTGSRYYTVGGNLWALGWQMYQDFGCPHCLGAGVLRNQCS
jgi:hypothetical protein